LPSAGRSFLGLYVPAPGTSVVDLLNLCERAGLNIFDLEL
jgi:hypothetical protein